MYPVLCFPFSVRMFSVGMFSASLYFCQCYLPCRFLSTILEQQRLFAISQTIPAKILLRMLGILSQQPKSAEPWKWLLFETCIIWDGTIENNLNLERSVFRIPQKLWLGVVVFNYLPFQRLPKPLHTVMAECWGTLRFQYFSIALSQK